MPEMSFADRANLWGQRARGKNDPNSPYFSPNFSDKAAQIDLRKTLAGGIGGSGYTPEQRAMLTAAMSRSLGRATEADQEALSRRFAAQGIGGTGLANAALTGTQGNLLSAFQQGLTGIDEQSRNQSLQVYLNAVNQLFGAEAAEAARRSAEKMASGGGPLDFLGAGVGAVAGGLDWNKILGIK